MAQVQETGKKIKKVDKTRPYSLGKAGLLVKDPMASLTVKAPLQYKKQDTYNRTLSINPCAGFCDLFY